MTFFFFLIFWLLLLLSIGMLNIFFCCIPLLVSAIEASDLLQKLSLDSQAKTIEIPDATKKVSIWFAYLYVKMLTLSSPLIHVARQAPFLITEYLCLLQPSVDSANIANGVQLDRSVTPLIPDFMDPTVCYLPNGYPSAYYYGGKFAPWRC